MECDLDASIGRRNGALDIFAGRSARRILPCDLLPEIWRLGAPGTEYHRHFRPLEYEQSPVTQIEGMGETFRADKRREFSTAISVDETRVVAVPIPAGIDHPGRGQRGRQNGQIGLCLEIDWILAASRRRACSGALRHKDGSIA